MVKRSFEEKVNILFGSDADPKCRMINEGLKRIFSREYFDLRELNDLMASNSIHAGEEEKAFFKYMDMVEYKDMVPVVKEQLMDQVLHLFTIGFILPSINEMDTKQPAVKKYQAVL